MGRSCVLIERPNQQKHLHGPELFWLPRTWTRHHMTVTPSWITAWHGNLQSPWNQELTSNWDEKTLAELWDVTQTVSQVKVLLPQVVHELHPYEVFLFSWWTDAISQFNKELFTKCTFHTLCSNLVLLFHNNNSVLLWRFVKLQFKSYNQQLWDIFLSDFALKSGLV